MLRCSDCGEHSPDTAIFCSLCGARLAQRKVLLARHLSATPTTTIPLHEQPANGRLHGIPKRPQAKSRLRAFQIIAPVLGIIFAAVFVIGIDKLFAMMGLTNGLLVILLLVCGALTAQCTWMNGNTWGGLRGMLLWGGVTWLLAIDQIVPWVLAILAGWVLLHPRWYSLKTKA